MKKLNAYITGFALSILLTLAAPGAIWLHKAMHHTFPTHNQIYIIFVVLAVLQLFVQLWFFLHLGDEKKPRFNLAALAFALMVVTIVVGGTLWIMNNLSHMQMETFIGGEVTPQTENDFKHFENEH